MYTDKVMDHFGNPRNVGVIENADGIGEEGNPVCGDMMTFYIKVEDGRLKDVRFQTFGCGAAIAVSSMVSTMAIGKTLAEAMQITRNDVAKELGGLPAQKMHCSNLGADALHKAIQNYLDKNAAADATVKIPEKSREDIYAERFGGPLPQAAPTALPTVKSKGCSAKEGFACCPFCDAEIPKDSPICEPCGKELAHCPKCGAIMPKGAHDCPTCGFEMN
ncbi:MAG: Fe-S cluster assembly scaffold protein NifU [Myxococcales bacterium]|nr:Fe-S cluster assembly scaffold protein NifU [Myxococcales bacterium]